MPIGRELFKNIGIASIEESRLLTASVNQASA
jgi:hypothetical protein